MQANNGSFTSNGNGTTQDLRAMNGEMGNMSLANKRKKKPARAFHQQWETAVAPPSSTASTPFMPPNALFNGNSNGYGFDSNPPSNGFITPRMDSTSSFQSPAPSRVSSFQTTQLPGLPLFPPQHQPENAIVVPVSGGISLVPAPAPSSELSLVDYRYHTQATFMTPTSDNDPLYPSFYTFQNSIPPTAGTQYLTVDQGTASPNYIRSSMYFVPETESLRAATKLPIALTIRPFAPSQDPVPVVDFRDLGNISGSDPLDFGPPRCRRCRAYVNPSMTFTSVSNFTCNVCQFRGNTVPQEYTSYLDAQGNRADKFVKPELHQGVYDILVPDEYNVGGTGSTNDELHHIFLVDISEPSIRQGLPAVVADSIRTALFAEKEDLQEQTGEDNEPSKKTIKYSIICFDKHIHFYNLSPKLQQTQVNVCTDLDDPFVPFFDGLFADKEESRIQIEDALTNMEQMTNDPTFLPDTESCFAVAIKLASMCLESHGGGKITTLLAGLPSWGPGGLKFKPNNTSGKNADAEKYLFLPNLDYYKALGKELVAQSVGVDLFVVAKTQVDMANVGYLCGVTGGNINRWTNFEIERDARGFHEKFVTSVKNPRGYQGQLKVRCSNGLQVAQYYGTYSNKDIIGDVMDPKVSLLTEDQTFTVLFEYDGKLDTKYDCHFQVALLYTDALGARKVRVINLVLAVAEKLQDVFNMVDEDTVMTTILRDSLSFMGKQSLKEIRESLNNKLVEVYTQYRAMSELGHNITNTMNRTLLFPEGLKHLPIYALAFLKSDALRNGNGITPDTRLAEMFNLMHMPVERLLYNLYPAMVELHSLDDEECTFDDYGFLRLPRFTELSLSKMEQGVYILCDSYRVYVWVDPNANILLVKDLFGENYDSVLQLDPMMNELPVLPTLISEQSHNLIKFFHSKIIGIPGQDTGSSIQLVRPGIDGSEIIFKLRLVEDNISRSLATPSYGDYLTSLHKAIRVNLDSDKASGKIKQSIDNVGNNSESLTQRFALF